MRKDVECNFGILKGRFCILRHGIRTKSIERCDEIWIFFALHNMFLFIDGLHENWENGKCSDWETSNANYEKRHNENFSINRFSDPSVGCKENDLAKYNYCNLDKHEVNNMRILERFKRNTIKWSRRCKTNLTV